MEQGNKEIRRDFFISRTGADAQAAEIIAGIIREAGLVPFYQNEDFGHADFMRRMEQGSESARVVALLSSRYQASEYCRAEYNHALVKDPGNLKEHLIVLRVEACEATGNLAALAYTDLTPVLGDPSAFRKLVRVALRIDTDRPAVDFWQAFRRQGQKIRHPEIRAVKGFTGRRDLLDQLREKLSGQIGTVAIRNSGETTLALRGMGGVGKTVLAIQYAWERQDDYQGLWWIRGETRASVVEDLAALGERMGIVKVGGVEPEQAAQLTLDGIAQMQSEKPWLLVYDNVDDQTIVRKLTPANNAHVLITTRLTEWHGEAEELPVDLFDQETAVAFLLAHAGKKADAEAASRLATALNRLPLALAHARSYCRERNWSFDQYIEHLPELIKRVPANARYPASVFATFSLAIERASQVHPLAEPLMSLFAYVAPEQIPLWLVPGQALEELECADALAALAQLSLLSMDRLESGAPAVSLHRLVQEVMRTRLAERGNDAPTLPLLAQMIETGFDSRGSFTEHIRNREWHPQALGFLAYAPRSGPEAWHTIWTHLQVGDFALSRGETSAPLAAYRAARDLTHSLAQTEPDADPFNTGWQRDLSVSHSRIGVVLQGQGNLSEALTSYRAALAGSQRLADADPSDGRWQRDLSVGHNKIGDTLVAQENLSQAMTHYQASMAIRERLADADPGNADLQRDLSVSRNKIGDVLADQGNLGEALTSYRAAMVTAQRLADADPGNAGWQHDLLVSHSKIGHVLIAQRNLSTALTTYQTAMAIAQRLADADPGNAGWQRDLSVLLERVADVSVQLGEVDDARNGYARALSIYDALIVRNAGDVQAQLSRVVPLLQLGKLEGAKGRERLESALGILREFDAADRLDANRRRWIAQIEADLASLDDAGPSVAHPSATQPDEHR